MDVTDCHVEEPQPFSSIWYSHEFKGAGLRYELGVDLFSGLIASVNGPFPCGSWSDLKIFRNGLLKKLLPNEKVAADGGCNHSAVVKSDKLSKSEARLISIYRAPHESANMRIKRFHVFRSLFRHKTEFRLTCFHAPCQVVQLSLMYCSSTNQPITFKSHRVNVLRGTNSVINTIQRDYNVPGLTIDFSSAEIGAHANGIFLESSIRGILEGKQYRSLDMIFPMVVAFIDTCCDEIEETPCTTIFSLYSNIICSLDNTKL